MSKTKAQLIEELNVLKDDYQKTKDFVSEVMAENEWLRADINKSKEALDASRKEFNTTKEILMDAWAESDAMREELNQAKEEGAILQDRIAQLQDDLHKLSMEYNSIHFFFRDIESDLKSELARQKRKYKALLNAMLPLAATAMFLAGMLIWMML